MELATERLKDKIRVESARFERLRKPSTSKTLSIVKKTNKVMKN